MAGTEPLSSAALASMIWDMDPNASTVFGESPYDALPAPLPSSGLFGKRLASVLDYMRQNIWPAIFDSLNTTPIQIIFRTQVVDVDDPLYVTTSETSLDIYGAVMGATAKNIERGFVIASDYECLVAANDLTGVPTATRDAVRVGGVNYDITGVLPCPRIPPAVGYRFFLRRAL